MLFPQLKINEVADGDNCGCLVADLQVAHQLLNLVKAKGIVQNKFLETWLLGGLKLHNGVMKILQFQKEKAKLFFNGVNPDLPKLLRKVPLCLKCSEVDKILLV